jgi:hypothetical protein
VSGGDAEEVFGLGGRIVLESLLCPRFFLHCRVIINTVLLMVPSVCGSLLQPLSFSWMTLFSIRCFCVDAAACRTFITSELPGPSLCRCGGQPGRDPAELRAHRSSCTHQAMIPDQA